MKVVILAGGLGTRLREETDIRPKPMVEIGGQPMLWHIMSHYANAGHREFVICTGYKGEVIKEWFRNLRSLKSDFTVTYQAGTHIDFHDEFPENDWKVTIADTGALTSTGGRIKRIEKYIGNEPFLCTYGDGLSDIDLELLVDFHRQHGKIATLSSVKPLTRFGVLDLDEASVVKSFREKPQTEGWINAGYFVFQPEIFQYLREDSVLEHEPLVQLSNEQQLMAFKHNGFWQPMDTYREKQELETLWNSGRAPWRGIQLKRD
jgi:glucose-1-phosphate cytidylyltransferase